jgi:hypothetical protein
MTRPDDQASDGPVTGIVRVVAVTDEDATAVRGRLVGLPAGVESSVVVTPAGTLVTLGTEHSRYFGQRHRSIRNLESLMSELIGR